MAPLTVDALLPELEARLGIKALRGTDAARAEAVLADAMQLVLAAVGSAITDPPQLAVTAVVLSVARRAYLNPAGVLSETVGPYTVRYGDDSPSGVYLTAAEQAILGRLRSGGHGLWSLSTTRGDDYLMTLYVGDQWAPLSDPIAFESLD